MGLGIRVGEPLDLDALPMPNGLMAMRALCERLIAELRATRAERDDWRRSTQELRNEMEEWDFDEEVARMRARAERAEDELARCAADALTIDTERMELAAAVARVEALLSKWLAEQAEYPNSYMGAAAAAVAVRLCEREIRAALRGDAE